MMAKFFDNTWFKCHHYVEHFFTSYYWPDLYSFCAPPPPSAPYLYLKKKKKWYLFVYMHLL